VVALGWQLTALWSGAGCFLLAALAGALLRHTPEQCGCVPDGAAAAAAYARNEEEQAVGAGEGLSLLQESDDGAADWADTVEAKRHARASPADAATGMTVMEAARTRAMWILVVNSFSVRLQAHCPFQHKHTPPAGPDTAHRASIFRSFASLWPAPTCT
jgi:hypothetical protein